MSNYSLNKLLNFKEIGYPTPLVVAMNLLHQQITKQLTVNYS